MGNAVADRDGKNEAISFLALKLSQCPNGRIWAVKDIDKRKMKHTGGLAADRNN